MRELRTSGSVGGLVGKPLGLPGVSACYTLSLARAMPPSVNETRRTNPLPSLSGLLPAHQTNVFRRPLVFSFSDFRNKRK